MDRYTLSGATLAVAVDERVLEFQRVGLTFLEHGMTDVFARKNNKTLEETLVHKKYSKLRNVFARDFSDSLREPLGSFLLNLKRSGNLLYKRFLNPHGDGAYCKFRMDRGPLSSKKGVYCYCVAEKLMYVGRTFDPFEKRINQGYGTIHPKNCFVDGQWPNCRLNALIGANASAVSLFVCPLTDDSAIDRFERRLIQILQPNWNIALKV